MKWSLADGAGSKGRPTIATLADGRFAVSWESGTAATATIFTTIFDPREAGLNRSASSFADDWQGTALADRVYLGTGNDVMAGGLGNDVIYGEDGQDSLTGQDDNDKLYGGNHNDTVNGGDGNDTLSGNLGNDLLNGDAGRDTLLGGEGIDTLNGGTGDDSLNGGSRGDIMSGGDDADKLTGAAGSDRLIGGAGLDVLTDGSLDDTFVFTAPGDGNDRIEDWRAVEKDIIEIDASGFGGGLVAGALAADRLVVGPSATANQAFGQFLYNTNNGQLKWDADGTGAGSAVNVARLFDGGVAVGSLAAGDFEIVA